MGDIIKQGEPGEEFYILEDGAAAAFISGGEGERKGKDYGRKGDYFGEIALLKDEPRKATVRAMEDGTSVLSISKEDFTSVLGPIGDMLKRDIDKYAKYESFLRD